eukprot:CAMPEP_0119104870 /NCGR_PEP_ID=MMETSP1180-20130426/2966_1 /TAXON_ID=3052 ORGANISM="Chlamydomonas cf sp, Strain CCMP681" /NCGR_SAMPLE_ID=MMETSP1180 /ASSEMBLY_ACC=CAM_ASM_000741 /LENGTH=112 /DNA_ID=CAMNT_0007089735 /DNA_START=1334 /DNA_END=1672 /DNA_ORIENTATION=+
MAGMEAMSNCQMKVMGRGLSPSDWGHGSPGSSKGKPPTFWELLLRGWGGVDPTPMMKHVRFLDWIHLKIVSTSSVRGMCNAERVSLHLNSSSRSATSAPASPAPVLPGETTS